MLFAERHQKLGRDSSRAHDRAEDLLTSTAFQLLRYLPPHAGLLAVLARVRSVRWKAGRIIISREPPPWLTLTGIDAFDLTFWPRWPGAGEPDVVVNLQRSGVVVTRLVTEVKLDSPKSPRSGESDGADDITVEPRRPDQLWDYYEQLAQEPGPFSRGLVYLTAHPMPPHDELLESLECCQAARETDWLGWLSWGDVWAAMRGAGPEQLPAIDLAEILAAKGFRTFDGFQTPLPAVSLESLRFFHPWFSPHHDWTRPEGPPTFWVGRRDNK